MPLELAREMARHYRTLADWMIAQAEALESGEAHYFEGGAEVSKELAADLRHRANNIEALILGFERITAREELKAAAGLPNSGSVSHRAGQN